MIKSEPRLTKHRVVTFLDRDQVDWLDRMGKDALFSTGAKFPRTRIIAGLIDWLRWVNVSGDGVRTDRDFQERLVEACRKAMAEGVRHANAA